MSIVYVSAVLTPAPEHVDAVQQALQDVVAPVRAESGCIRYDLHCRRDAQGTITAFLFYEIWESQAALDAHGKTPHLGAMGEKIAGKLASDPIVDVWKAVDVKD